MCPVTSAQLRSAPKPVAQALVARQPDATPPQKSAATTPPRSPEIQSTPAKRSMKDPAADTSAEKRSKPDGFGGACSKASVCQLCGQDRARGQRGSTCDFCLLACRQICQHQRVKEAMGSEETKAALAQRSLELRAAASEKPAINFDRKEVTDLLKHVKTLISRCNGFYDRLDKLEAAIFNK